MPRAATFAKLVELIGIAEQALIKNADQHHPIDRACTLRGAFYGTEWSRDYQVESARSESGAQIRNLGFIAYTGGNIPADPRPALGEELFRSLRDSYTVSDRGRAIDVGHILIGLETRSSAAMRTVPMLGQGGTGVEIVSWLGDLGGGAANLARRRITVPSTSVETVFFDQKAGYGAMDNLEGDAGAYLVACGDTPGGAPAFQAGEGIAGALGRYLPLTADHNWQTRAARFASALGATISPTGITNAAVFSQTISSKLYDFAIWYAATRWIPSGQLRGKATFALGCHLPGAAREVAAVFVALLARGIVQRGVLRAAGPYPRPTPPGDCESDLLRAASVDVSSVRKRLDKWRSGWQKLFQ